VSFITELRVPPESAFASLVKHFAADAVRRGGLTDEQQRDMVEAARRGFESILATALVENREPIRAVAACTPAHFCLSFFERGLPIDDALARRDPSWDRLLGLVDEAHWHLRGAEGSELRLIATRRHGPVVDPSGPPAQEDDVTPAPPQEYTIRRFQRNDADGVARAFYLTYGYAYDLSAVYVPAHLIELNESGAYTSIVAVTAAGDVIGHYALAREGNEPIADACGAIVLPAHRGRNLLNRLRDRAEEEAIALGLAAYYSEPVTDHPRTQESSESFGAKACGITLGEAPRSFLARHMELSTTSQRQSCMLYVKPLRPREPRAIYAPQRHRAVISRIYEELGLPVTMLDGESATGRGRFRTAVARGDGTGMIAVETVGAETGQLVRQAVKDLRALRRLGAIYASLPLEEPGTPALCETLESCGFFFSGVGPWMQDGKDALRLQLLLAPIDLSVLVIVGALGKSLLDYIEAERDRVSSGIGYTR
jgi:hypothetical protein